MAKRKFEPEPARQVIQHFQPGASFVFEAESKSITVSAGDSDDLALLLGFLSEFPSVRELLGKRDHEVKKLKSQQD